MTQKQGGLSLFIRLICILFFEHSVSDGAPKKPILLQELSLLLFLIQIDSETAHIGLFVAFQLYKSHSTLLTTPWYIKNGFPFEKTTE